MATILGGESGDSLAGTIGGDLLIGLGGADTLLGGDGNDTLDAGTGTDRLDGGGGADRAVIDRSTATAGLLAFVLAPGFATTIGGALLTGVEHVTLATGSGADSLVGGVGDDVFAAGDGADALAGRAGADVLRGGAGDDSLLGGAGADLLEGGPGADAWALQDATTGLADSTLLAMDTVRGFDAASGDRLWLRGQSAGGAVLLLDGPGRFGLAGQPLLPIGFGGALAAQTAPVLGLALPDASGGAAVRVFWVPSATQGENAGWVILDVDRDGVLGTADLVARIEFAGPGGTIGAADFAPDSFATLGTPGADSILGGAGDETIHGFAGADLVQGGTGSDSLLGEDGEDTLLGLAGFDTLRAGAGADSLDGGADADVLDGSDGADRLDGGAGADLLLGGAGADLLTGGEGDDTLEGAGRGEAVALPGPEGGDSLGGSAGADLFVLQGAGDPAWSTLARLTQVTDFAAIEGDRLRIGTAGAVADAGTLLGADGVARPLVWGGSPGQAQTSLSPGLRLPAQPLPGLDAIQVFWIRAVTAGGAAAGGWLVLDLDQDGLLGTADAVIRIGSAAAPATIGAADFIAGSFMAFGAATAPAGTADADTLHGTARSESFLGSTGADSIDGGAGAPNAISYAALSGPITYAAGSLAGAGVATKPDGAADLLRAIQSVTGTGFGDTLDGSAAPAESFYVLSLEGAAGADRLIGNGARSVQASYAGSPAAVRVDLAAGTAEDGWGSIDSLIAIRRIAATSAFDDTVIGSTADEVFLSGTEGSKRFEGGGGIDEYRYVGTGAASIVLTEEIIGVFRIPAHADKPGGARDTLVGISVGVGGAGDDTVRGGAAEERLAGGPGDDSLDGGAGLDTVFYETVSAAAGLAQRGVVLDLDAGTATDPWGGTDHLVNIEHAWGTPLADIMAGLAVAGQVSYLRGLIGDDTLRAPADGTLVAADYAADPAGISADLAAGWVLDGWGGRDALERIAALRGSAFADTVAGSAAADRIEGGDGNDSLAGTDGSDLLLGDAGGDTLDGGPGVDTLAGGPGDDLYIVDSPFDRIVEAPGEGNDTLIAAIPIILPDGIELALVPPDQPGGVELQGQSLSNLVSGAGGPDRLLGWGADDTLEGGNGSDTLFGNIGADSLAGSADNDRLLGGLGNDTASGGAGNDTIYGEDDDDRLAGEDGEDALVAGFGADAMDGGNGSDTLWGQFGNDTLSGGTGTDWLLGGDAEDFQDGGDGNDVVYGELGNDSLLGGAGTDFLYGGYGEDTLDGGADPDSLRGDLGNDRLSGALGNDFAYGGLGDDALDGGDGIDTLWGEDGNDLLIGGDGNDWLLGGPNEDNLRGDAGVDNLFGHDGNDTLDGGTESDWIRGGSGDDLLLAGAGVDNLWGEAGRDTLDGGAGTDLMNGGLDDDLYLVDSAGDLIFEQASWGEDSVIAGVAYRLPPFIEHLTLLDAAGDAGANGNDLANRIAGNAGANFMVGWGGDDALIGAAGADTLLGLAGNDWLAGGQAADLLLGGAGADIYVFGAGDGADLVWDYEVGVDRIALRGIAAEAVPGVLAGLAQVGSATLLNLGNGDTLTLVGVAAWLLGPADLLLV